MPEPNADAIRGTGWAGARGLAVVPFPSARSKNPWQSDGAPAPTNAHAPLDPTGANCPGALSLHERLSAALRVAELSGIESLARRYRERLAHEARGGKASGRLLMILRYAELSQSYPTHTLKLELAKLARSGMSAEEISELSAVIEFVAYQARVLVAFGCFEDAP